MGLFEMIPYNTDIKTYGKSYTTQGYSFTYRIGGRLELRSSWDYRRSGLPRESVKQQFMETYCREVFEPTLRERFICWSWLGGCRSALEPLLCLFQPTYRQQLVLDANAIELAKDAADKEWHAMGTEFRMVLVECSSLPKRIDFRHDLNRLSQFEWVRERFPALIRSEREVFEFVRSGSIRVPASARSVLDLIEEPVRTVVHVNRPMPGRKPKAIVREKITREWIIFDEEG